MNNYPEFVKAIAKPLDSKAADFNHACLGLVGEVGELADAIKRWLIYENELNKENVLEELGDLRFYMQMLINNNDFKIKPTTTLHPTLIDCVFEMSYYTGFICGNTSDESKKAAFQGLRQAFLSMCILMRFTEENVIQHNVAKLIKRYPNGKYSNEDANERKDKNV